VVWVSSPTDGEPLEVAELALLFEDLDLALVVEQSAAPPSLDEALETLAVYRAVAVVWHDRDGALQLLLAESQEPERLSTVAGRPTEEALFVREVLRGRMLDSDEFTADLLVTVPGEVVDDLPRRPEPRRTEPPPVVHFDSNRPIAGGRLGGGYAVRAHFDRITWGQHLLTVQAPAWRFEPGVVLRVVLEVAFPQRIGDYGVTWLELSSVGAQLGAAWIPTARRWFEFEVGGGAGFVESLATAFLANGESQRADHLSGQLGFWFALGWHPTPTVDLRVHLDGTYLLATPSFSIGGRGNFGSYAWQPGAGVDIAVALF
jgi:hypothetical protein